MESVWLLVVDYDQQIMKFQRCGNYVVYYCFVCIFFSIIMGIHITANKYIVNTIWKQKNCQKFTNIYKTESIQKHYLNYFIRKLKLGKRK